MWFPWKTPGVDFAVWVAETLTIAVRHAFFGATPIFVHTANSPGSGKTKLAEAATVIATGRDLKIAPYPVAGRKAKDLVEDAEEIRKVATSAAIQNDVSYMFDNVPNGFGFGSSVFDTIATATNNSGRKLGVSETPSRTALTVWMLTGNNIYPVGDSVRRCLISQLHSTEEKPEDREYDGPEVVTWARRDRGKLFTACVTIVSAYILAGRPKQAFGPMGSFEARSDLIRSSVVLAGLPDPLISQKSFKAEDPAKIVIADLIRLVELAIPPGSNWVTNKQAGVTVSSIIKLVMKELKESQEAKVDNSIENLRIFPALEAYRRADHSSNEPDSYVLSNLLSKYKGVVVGGKEIQRQGDLTRDKVAIWFVKKTEDRASCRGEVRGTKIVPPAP